MVSHSNLTEIPNLLELLEAYRNDPITCGDLSICGDEITRLPSSLMDLSLCADEGTDNDPALRFEDQSVCADEGPAGGPLETKIDHLATTVSVCADEAPTGVRHTDIEQVGSTFSVCADEAESDVRLKTDAVVMGQDGYYRVKYGQLGIRMTRA